MTSAVREFDMFTELAIQGLATYALVGGCILVVALVIAGLVIFIRLLLRRARNNRIDVL